MAFSLSALRNKMMRRQIRKNCLEEYSTRHLVTTLTAEQKKQIREYYGPYVKNVDPCAHAFFTQCMGEFHVDYMPDMIHYCYIDPYFNDWREANYVDNKCFYPRYFHGIKQAEILCSRINGMWFCGDFQQISAEQAYKLVENEPEIVVKKAMGSEGGRGVYFVKGSELEQVQAKIRDDVAVQRPLVQHPYLAQLNDTSINSIRIISLLSDEGVKCYSGILRIGIKGSRVDNASGGGLTCGIHNGKLRKYAFDCIGHRLEEHPDSKVPFLDHPIPSYDKCLEAAKRLHVQVPRFRLISWDFTVNPEGEPVLIEANFKYGGLDIHQMNNGPIFGEDTKKILDEVFGKK